MNGADGIRRHDWIIGQLARRRNPASMKFLLWNISWEMNSIVSQRDLRSIAMCWPSQPCGKNEGKFAHPDKFPEPA
jgi:hypothetical protein